MKLSYMSLAIAFWITFSSQGQNFNPTFASTVSETDRQTLVRSSVPLTDWHEKTFWPQYNDYRERILNLSLQTYESLNDLAGVTRNTSDALEIGREMIANRLNELAVRQQSY